MSILTEPLQNSVTVDGISYPVNTDFRVWLRFYELIKSGSLDFKIITDAIILCYKGGKLPPSFFKAFDALLFFFSGKTDNSKPEKKEKNMFDFTEDAELIFASFLSDYGIDLTNETMHWHKFLSLLKSLSAESSFMRVVSIRSINPYEITDKKYRDEIIKKQKIFALKGSTQDESFAENLFKVM